MNKKDLERIHLACELIETGQYLFSCPAIWCGNRHPLKQISRFDRLDLSDRYAQFYNIDYPYRGVSWWWTDLDSDSKLESLKNIRIIAMLLFAEAEESVQ